MHFELSLVPKSYHAFTRAIARSLVIESYLSLLIVMVFHTQVLSRVQSELAFVPEELSSVHTRYPGYILS